MTVPNPVDPSRYPETMRSDIARYLHDEVHGAGNWDSLSDSQRDNWFFSADRLIKRIVDPALDDLRRQGEAATNAVRAAMIEKQKTAWAEHDRVSAENRDLRAALDDASEARDAAGYAGTPADCIRFLSDVVQIQEFGVLPDTGVSPDTGVQQDTAAKSPEPTPANSEPGRSFQLILARIIHRHNRGLPLEETLQGAHDLLCRRGTLSPFRAGEQSVIRDDREPRL